MEQSIHIYKLDLEFFALFFQKQVCVATKHWNNAILVHFAIEIIFVILQQWMLLMAQFVANRSV